MQRVWLLNWENITYDYDLTNYLDAIISDWVIKWLDFQDWKITKWQAIIQVSRDNWQKFFVHFENSEDLEIDLSRDWKVFIEINQDKINDWEKNMEDWSWIWEIKVSNDIPEKNSLKLWYISGNSFFTDKKKIVLKNDLLEKSGLTNLTKMWNEFNSAWKLLKLDEEWKIPNLDWSKITWIIPQVSSFDEEAMAGSDIEKWDLVWWEAGEEFKKWYWGNGWSQKWIFLIKRHWYNDYGVLVKEINIEHDCLLKKCYATIWFGYVTNKPFDFYIVKADDNDDLSKLDNFMDSISKKYKIVQDKRTAGNNPQYNTENNVIYSFNDVFIAKWKYYAVLDFREIETTSSWSSIYINARRNNWEKIIYYSTSKHKTENSSYEVPLELNLQRITPNNILKKISSINSWKDYIIKWISKENASNWEKFKYTKYWKIKLKELIKLKNTENQEGLNIWDWASYRKLTFSFTSSFYWINKVFLKKLSDIWDFKWGVTFKLMQSNWTILESYGVSNNEWKKIPENTDFLIKFDYFWLENNKVYSIEVETGTQTSNGFIRLWWWTKLWESKNYNWTEWVDSLNYPKIKIIEELKEDKKYYLSGRYIYWNLDISAFGGNDSIWIWRAVSKNELFFKKDIKEKKPVIMKSWNNNIEYRTSVDVDIPIKWKPKKIKFHFSDNNRSSSSITSYDVENWFIEWVYLYHTDSKAIFWWDTIGKSNNWHMSIKSLTENNIKINIYASNSNTYYYKLALIY